MLKNWVFVLITLTSATLWAKGNVATFAGGCFWDMQATFDAVPGVVKTVVGYGGGKEANPTYEDVSLGETSHFEAIQVTYNPEKISYSKLLEIYWHNIDPLDDKGQFCDKGKQYRSAIFYHDETQKQEAEASLKALQVNPTFKQIYTEIRPFTTFFPAEEYHQEYYKKNPIRYKYYRVACGQERRLKQLWGNK